MRRFHTTLLLAPLAGALACSDFLSGGELDTDPVRPTSATNSQIFVGTQSALWSVLMSDPARIAALWTQQLSGTNIQTQAIYNYDVTEQTTNGFHQAIYTAGGLVDIRKLQARAAESRDSLMLGIAQVEEALLVGTAADLFGDITYSEALQFDRQNPALDPQLEVYDALQALLDRAIANLRTTAPTNQGPGDADLSYGGDAAQWTRLAYTLKARFYLHTAEVRPAAYAQALAAARQGITSAADDYVAAFSGALNEQNFWYQFDVVQRAGYLTPDPTFVALLRTRNDPRLGRYFNATQSGFHAELIKPDHTQQLVSAAENLLIWAEAAQRGGNDAEARTQLDRARA
ncbi:MAG TPA: SusD/RagB family nutrient-binding outer membrane lipoprotein, partial [Gemmatimonadaceae bacterium]|nr:SusD/RagB family nutrient-binding outer membrane lipoprotein [Gemmatimonadaceae bacterium]